MKEKLYIHMKTKIHIKLDYSIYYEIKKLFTIILYDKERRMKKKPKKL